MSETTIVSQPPVEIRKDDPQSPWEKFYVWGIAILGLMVVILAGTRLPGDRVGLLAFVILAAVAELTNVELFASSHSRISVASVAAVASIMLFGPQAGILTAAAIGIMTALTTTFLSQKPGKGRASPLERAMFNIGMLVISAAMAGLAYQKLGGMVGNVQLISNILPLIGAVGVNVLVNLLILIGIIMLQTSKSPLAIWDHYFKWSAPITFSVCVLGGGMLALAYDRFGLVFLGLFFLPILAISYSYRLYVNHTRNYLDELEKTNLRLEEVIDQLNGSNQDLLDVLSALVDSDDIFTRYHSKYVAVYSVKIAKKMNISSDELDLLEKAALIHDIGKIGVKDSIIGKPGKLTADEYNEVKRHPIIGARIIGRVRGFQALVPLVRGHHERWDGKGYPDGLAGEDIPKLARIISLADSVEAMLTDRVHREGRNISEVVEEIQRCSGTQFDPRVVEAFFKVVDEEDIGFFVNSAALADRFVFLAGVDPEKTKPRYMKNNILD